MDTFIAKVKGYTDQLLHKDVPRHYKDIIEALFSETATHEGAGFAPGAQAQVEEIAIQLWNWAVTKHVGSAINDEQKAKVRHAACRLLYACEPVNPSETMLRRQILMATKSGRTWLDCKKFPLAEDFFNLAVKSLEILYSKLSAVNGGSTDVNITKADVEKDLLRVLTYQAESALAQDNHDKAVSFMCRCKDMLMRLPNETNYMCLMCYNFGVDTYNKKKYEESAFWLSQSYDIGKTNMKNSPGSSVTAKALRLLANVYLEWRCPQYQEKALDAVCLANKEYIHPLGLYLKIRILLSCDVQEGNLRSAIMEIMDADVALDVCLSTVKLLMGENRDTLAFDLLKMTCQKFESSPELGSALILHVQLLLQRGKQLLAKQKVEEIISGHFTGKLLSPQALTHLHLLLWDSASKHFEEKQHSEALQWYDYSLNFFPSGQMDPNLGKLQRNRASCFLRLQQLDKAKEAIKEAERCDPNSIFTQFSIYKMAVLGKDTERAVQAVQELSRLAGDPVQNEDLLMTGHSAASNLLSLAAQIALEHEQHDLAVTALERVCESSRDGTQIFTALRCLVRLQLSTVEKSSEEMRDKNHNVLLSYLKIALQRVSHVTGEAIVDPEKRTEEAGWFRKMAWNLALQCENNTGRMKDFFLLSYQFSQFCSPDKGVLMAQKTCLVMVIATCLELFRKTADSAPQPEELTQALEHIPACREIWKTLKASGEFPNDPTDTLLQLYEFEACAKLNHPRLENVMETMMKMEDVEAKTMEIIAALAMEPPAHFPLLCKKALRMALCLHKNQPQPDTTRCSQCVHSLIQLSLPSGVCEVEPHTLEEAWGYYQEELALMAIAPEQFPELEIVWLLTRAWNTGVLLCSLAQFPEAERWCGLGMSFLRHLRSLQESYQSKMSGLYAEVLDRMDRARRNVTTEE